MRVQMRTEITKLHQRLQATMIYVTHDQIEAMTMGDRIVVTNNGKVQQTDTPLKLYNEPDNLFVAGFLGSPPMNFINGELKQERDAVVFKEMQGGTIEVRFKDRPRAREFLANRCCWGSDRKTLSWRSFPIPATRPRIFRQLWISWNQWEQKQNLYLQTGAHTVACRSQRALDHRRRAIAYSSDLNASKAHLFDPATTSRVI